MCCRMLHDLQSGQRPEQLQQQSWGGWCCRAGGASVAEVRSVFPRGFNFCCVLNITGKLSACDTPLSSCTGAQEVQPVQGKCSVLKFCGVLSDLRRPRTLRGEKGDAYVLLRLTFAGAWGTLLALGHAGLHIMAP